MTFSFKRRVGYYLIQVYFPDIFVVALSWIVFWMDKEDMGNRMALGITTILTIMFLLGSLNGTLPKVSYPKALDWYLLASFAFVFLSMVECMIVFVLNLSATEDKEKIKCKVFSFTINIFLMLVTSPLFSLTIPPRPPLPPSHYGYRLICSSIPITFFFYISTLNVHSEHCTSIVSQFPTKGYFMPLISSIKL